MKLMRWFEKNWDISLIIVMGILVIIFTLSSFGEFSPPSKKGSSLFSIIYHFSAFFFLNLFLLFAFVRGNKHDFIIIAILISITYGIFDEIHQLFVPGRTSDFFDVMMNNTGICFSSIFYMFFMNTKKGRI